MRILLIGNGFDLNYGLPTKYENFLHVINFLDRCYTSDMKTVGSIMSNAKLQEVDKWITKCYARYKDGWDNAPVSERDIKNLITLAQKNMWFTYLSESLDIPEILTIMYHEESKICDFMKNIITMYGKEGLDRLRTQNRLNFYPLNPKTTTERVHCKSVR